jgi:hypothetical protein
MALTINHETNDISNATGTIIVNGVAVGGDNTPPPWYGSRGVFFGGTTDGNGLSNVIDYITIATTGNATDFGDLTAARKQLGDSGTSNGSRGVIAGGSEAGGTTNKIEYVTIATTANSTDFGDLTVVANNLAGSGDGARGLFAGGGRTGGVIDYITIATTGNATDFGDLLTGQLPVCRQ